MNINELDNKLNSLDDKLIDEKEKLCLEYAKGGVNDAYSYLGDIYYFDKDDLNKAMDYYSKCTNNGYAIYMQGVIYENIYYEKQDLDKAKECLLKAANDYEYKDAIYEIGFNYLNGNNGYEKNAKKAVEYLKKAVDLKYSEAYYSLALCYKNGTGVEKDLNKAFDLMKEAYLLLNGEE
ncbi:MAG: sel1 repeat family protein [Acholeplasmatales bacterium]|nr:sel1 repeat family protein [Acholeplasmatales bacterium]